MHFVLASGLIDDDAIFFSPSHARRTDITCFRSELQTLHCRRESFSLAHPLSRTPTAIGQTNHTRHMKWTVKLIKSYSALITDSIKWVIFSEKIANSHGSAETSIALVACDCGCNANNTIASKPSTMSNYRLHAVRFGAREFALETQVLLDWLARSWRKSKHVPASVLFPKRLSDVC